MTEVSIIGPDLAKNVFQAHGAAADGPVGFRHPLSRVPRVNIFAAPPLCGGAVGMSKRTVLMACCLPPMPNGSTLSGTGAC